jgi:hypothetical protein
MDTCRLKYIIGLDWFALNNRSPYSGYFEIKPDLSGTDYSKWLLLGNDASQNTSLDGLFGYGIYNLEIYKQEYSGYSFTQICPTVTIDWTDFNYPYYSNVNGGEDLFIFINSIEDITLNKFQWNSNADGELISIFGEDSPLYPEGNIQVYKQYHSFDTVHNEWVGYNLHNEHPRSTGNSFSDSYFLDYPVDGRNLLSPYTIPTHLNSGEINGNLILLQNVNTLVQFLDYPTIFTIKPGLYLKLEDGIILDLKEFIPPNDSSYFEMNVETNGKILLNPYSKIIIRKNNKLYLQNDSRLYLGSGAEIVVKQGGLFCNYGASIRGGGKIVYEGGIIHHIQCASLADYVIRDSTKYILDSNAVLEIPDSTTLHFTGSNTALIMNPNSVIKLGAGSKIVIDSSAAITAKGAQFTSADTNDTREGIVLENSGIDSIINCTFSNAKTAVSIVNDPGYSFAPRVFKGNTFIVPSGGDYRGVYGENNFRITIEDNVFNMPVNQANNVFGVFLKNTNTEGLESLPEEIEPAPIYRIFLIDNIFNHGKVSLLLLNYTSSFLPFYVKGNTFNSAEVIGLLGRNITGSIKDNITSNNDIPMGIHLIASSPDLFNNTISSQNASLHTIGSSYPNLAPIVSGSSLVWRGGKNRLSSIQSDNIQLVHAGNVYTNLGENRFTVADTSENSYHIYGWTDTSVHNYSGKNNCWYPGNNPKINLRRIYTEEPVVTETGVTNTDCVREINTNSLLTEYLGNGMYDTAYVSPDTSNSNLTEEELLYNQGQNYIAASMFTEGISALKNLTDTYNYFYDLPASVYDLYSCYEYLDTTSLQSYRNTLYGNLKIYLEDKIENGDYDAGFLSNAYNVILMCDANMLNYDDAANGYEFISLFHPDPDIRLNASWDYAEIEALMGGGSGERDMEFEKNKEVKETSRIEKLATTDPVMKKMKESFEKTSKDIKDRKERKEKIDKKERTENQFKENSSSTKNGKGFSIKSELLTKEAESDKFKSDKAKRNIFELKNLNRQELEKRRIEDILVSAIDIRNEADKTQTLRVPMEYKLFQNYPNPFNPVTHLEFRIPESGFVSLKVYDILGREVAVLVNEKLSPGRYKTEFNGSNFASGVYFIRMEAGDFREIKKMILIK